MGTNSINTLTRQDKSTWGKVTSLFCVAFQMARVPATTSNAYGISEAVTRVSNLPRPSYLGQFKGARRLLLQALLNDFGQLDAFGNFDSQKPAKAFNIPPAQRPIPLQGSEQPLRLKESVLRHREGGAFAVPKGWVGEQRPRPPIIKKDHNIKELDFSISYLEYSFGMERFSTTQAAKKLGIAVSTLSRYISDKKIPSPEIVRIGNLEVHSWTEKDIDQVREILPKIANGRKTRYSKLKKQQKKR